MCRIVAAILAFLNLAGVAWSQQQIEFTLAWQFDVPKVTKQLHSPNALKKWRQEQDDAFLSHFDKHLRFWKFKAADAMTAPVTLRMVIEQRGKKVEPDIYATAIISFGGGQDYPIWSCNLVPSAELKGWTDGGYDAEDVLRLITERLNDKFLKDEFHNIVKPAIAEHAWVAVQVEMLPDDEVGLPLPWERCKDSAQSVFRIDCDDHVGMHQERKANGLSKPWAKLHKSYLKARAEKPLKGLYPRLVFVVKWLDLPAPVNPEILEARK